MSVSINGSLFHWYAERSRRVNFNERWLWLQVNVPTRDSSSARCPPRIPRLRFTVRIAAAGGRIAGKAHVRNKSQSPASPTFPTLLALWRAPFLPSTSHSTGAVLLVASEWFGLVITRNDARISRYSALLVSSISLGYITRLLVVIGGNLRGLRVEAK